MSAFLICIDKLSNWNVCEQLRYRQYLFVIFHDCFSSFIREKYGAKFTFCTTFHVAVEVVIRAIFSTTIPELFVIEVTRSTSSITPCVLLKNINLYINRRIG